MSTTSTTGTATAARLGDGIDAELRHLLPESLCRTFRVMPYAVVDGTVLVASADADDEIALEVGYASAFSLSKAFKRHFGEAPTHFVASRAGA